MGNKTIRIAEHDYKKDDCENLREQVIFLRNASLSQGQMSEAVMLSHVIAFMAMAIEELYKENLEDVEANPV